MFEAAATEAQRDAIKRAHLERAQAFAAGIAWFKGQVETLTHFGTPAASGR